MWFKKKQENSHIWVVVSLIIAILFVLGLYSFWTLRYVAWQLDDLGEISIGLAEDLNQTGLDLDSETLLTATTVIDDIQMQLNKLSFVRIFPIINRTYFYLNDVFYQTEKLFFSLEKLSSEYKEVSSLSTTQGMMTAYLQQTTPDELAKKISRIKAEFTELNYNLRALNDDLIFLSNNWLMRRQQQALVNLTKGMDNFIQATSQSSELLELAPAILGYPEPVNYLLLFQNNHEIRPTGGFIGTYGILSIDRGRIVNFYTDDIYHLDSQVIGQLEIEPPSPIHKYLDVQYWYMRDSNWSPDFPTAAQEVMRFYNLEGGSEELDGVIAITPVVVSDILEITGEVILNSVLYEADNFTNILQYEVEQNYQARGDSHWDRKDVIGQLAEILIQQIFKLSLGQTVELVSSVHENLSSKNLQVYLNDLELQAFISKKNWSGEIRDWDSDYLMVIDSNMAAYKTNQHIIRTVDYEVNKQTSPQGQKYLTAKVKIHYEHSGDFSWDTTRYRTYTRIYVPAGSILSAWSGAMDNDRSNRPGQIDFYQENGKTVFGAFIAVEPGEVGELVFEYRLPSELLFDYELLYQKQAGVVDSLSVDLFGQDFNYQAVNKDLVLIPKKY